MQVDFFLLAGDLFEKRTVDPLAMRVAIEGFRLLREAGIPVVAVEGNHERAHYRDQYSWLDFLDGLGYLYLLNPRFENGWLRIQKYEALEPILTDAMKAKTTQEWVEELEQVGIPCGPVNTIPQVAADAQVAAREMIIEVHHPRVDNFKVVRICLVLL